jgi:Domain of unknown function (DUF1707)
MPDTGDLRIGDADRDMIAAVLEQHMVDGRLTADELDERLGRLNDSQTREQARTVVADLPPLAPSDGEPHETVPVLPDWATAPSPTVVGPPATGAAAVGDRPEHIPTDGEMSTAYRRWQAKAEKARADKAAHKRAEASGDARETARALMRLKMSRGEENSARAKLDQLRKRRPDWSAGAS